MYLHFCHHLHAARLISGVICGGTVASCDGVCVCACVLRVEAVVQSSKSPPELN